MAKSLPPHGTTARYTGRPGQGIQGCHCDDCRAANTRYNKLRRLKKGRGESYTVDPKPAIEHVRHLFAHGAGWNLLESVSGCDHNTVLTLFHGQPSRIYRRTEQRILRVRLADVVPQSRAVPSLGSVRRLRALMAHGYEVQEMAKTTGCASSHLRNVLAGRLGTISMGSAQRIAAAYGLLSQAPGGSVRSLNRAQREGWLPPSSWVDDDLDTPELTATSRQQVILEDALELARFGETRERIAERLGVEWNTVTVAFSRAALPTPVIAA